MKKIICELLIAIAIANSVLIINGAADSAHMQLSRAIIAGDNAQQAEELIREGANINESAHSIYPTPLLIAIQHNRPNIFRLLLNSGADPNGGYSTTSPLYAAVDHDNVDFAKLLLDRGAQNDISLRQRETPLHLAVNRLSFDIVKSILDHKADINVKNSHNGDTPLHYAANRGSADMVRLLLSYSPDNLAENKRGQTPLDIANARGNQEIIDLLTEYDNSFPITKGTLEI